MAERRHSSKKGAHASLILACLIALLHQGLANYHITQVTLLIRHGTRELLGRDRITQADGVKLVHLTETGVEQMKQIGQDLKDRYVCPSGQGHIDGLTGTYQEDRSAYFSLSSDTERTLMTAAAFNQGLWSGCNATYDGLGTDPYAGVVPVHSVAARDDLMLLGYKNCPAFHDKVEEFYSSPEFTGLAAQEEDFLTRLYGCFQDQVASLSEGAGLSDAQRTLADMASLWDYAATAELAAPGALANATGGACSSADLPLMEVLANHVEHGKYTTDGAGVYLGSRFLREAAYAATERAGFDAWGRGVAHGWEEAAHLVHTPLPHFREREDVALAAYAAHYPTLKGVLAALGTSVADQLPVVPAWGAALALELHEHESGAVAPAVGLRYHAGVNGTFELLDLSSLRGAADGGVPSLGASFVTLGDFLARVEQQVYATDAAWCAGCRNDEAAACLAAELALLRSELGEDVVGAYATAVTLALFGGVALGALGYCTMQRYACRRKRAGEEEEEGAVEFGWPPAEPPRRARPPSPEEGGRASPRRGGRGGGGGGSDDGARDKEAELGHPAQVMI